MPEPVKHHWTTQLGSRRDIPPPSSLSYFIECLLHAALPLSGPKRAQHSLAPQRPVMIEPVSANRLHENGNFCGLGGDFWQILAKVAIFRRLET
jgi:hypothetical protein